VIFVSFCAAHSFPRHILVTDALAGPERRSVAAAGADAFRCGPQVSVSFVSLGWSDGGCALENPFILAHVKRKR